MLVSLAVDNIPETPSWNPRANWNPYDPPLVSYMTPTAGFVLYAAVKPPFRSNPQSLAFVATKKPKLENIIKPSAFGNPANVLALNP